jgi:hypothetical protein
VFAALLALDYMHMFEFVTSMSTSASAKQPVALLGNWLPGVTNGVFDALAYAAVVTATIYFVSNTLARRLANGESSGMYWVALIVGSVLSALANAGTMFANATGKFLISPELLGPVAAVLGGIVTFGLLMFASMVSWDLREKMLRTRARQEAAERTRTEEERKAKFTPKRYRRGDNMIDFPGDEGAVNE